MQHSLSRPIPLRPRRRPLLSRILAAFAVKRQRRHLRALSKDQLADLGLTRTEAEAESRRSLWDAPQHWHR